MHINLRVCFTSEDYFPQIITLGKLVADNVTIHIIIITKIYGIIRSLKFY